MQKRDTLRRSLRRHRGLRSHPAKFIRRRSLVRVRAKCSEPGGRIEEGVLPRQGVEGLII